MKPWNAVEIILSTFYSRKQKSILTKEILCDNVYLETEVDVRKFNIDSKKLDEKGTGKCILTNHSFKFIGDLNVKEFEIEINNLRALAFSTGLEFECYYNNELYYFYPKTNRQQCTKWALIVDELVKGVDSFEEK